VPRAASSDMKQNVGSSYKASALNPASLGIELDNDGDPDATVITVSGQGQNTDLLSQMTGWSMALRIPRCFSAVATIWILHPETSRFFLARHPPPPQPPRPHTISPPPPPLPTRTHTQNQRLVGRGGGLYLTCNLNNLRGVGDREWGRILEVVNCQAA
jgi:hypothetical protein